MLSREVSGGARPKFRAEVWALGFLATVGCHGPHPDAQAPEPLTSSESSPEAPADSAVTEGAAAPSTGQRYCPAAPYSVPFIGKLQASIVEGTEPTTLDAADQDFHLYEGAVWRDGALYFSDFKTSEGFPSRILRYTPGQPLAVAIADSGSNGLTLDPSGAQLVAARHSTKSVAVVDGAEAGRVFAQHFQGKPFNSPNDLVFRADGTLYFTDPDFQAGERADQASTNVYWVTPTGAVTAIDTGIKNPNGIALSLDDGTLYVAGNLERGYLKSYPVAEDGSVGAGKILLDQVIVPDGLTLDCAGNIYVTEHTQRRVRVVSSTGQELGQIEGMEHNVTNVAFGGADRQTLYITTTGAIYQADMPLPGLPY